MKRKRQLYFCCVLWGGIEPRLEGPFASRKALDKELRNLFLEQEVDGFHDCVFIITTETDVPADVTLEVSTFSGGEIEEMAQWAYDERQKSTS